MRHLFILLFFGFSISISAQEKEIKQSISVFFDGLQTSYTPGCMERVHPDLQVVYMGVYNCCTPGCTTILFTCKSID